jgi:hypothetical protein
MEDTESLAAGIEDLRRRCDAESAISRDRHRVCQRHSWRGEAGLSGFNAGQ